jgi:hypothetical protein
LDKGGASHRITTIDVVFYDVVRCIYGYVYCVGLSQALE